MHSKDLRFLCLILRIQDGHTDRRWTLYSIYFTHPDTSHPIKHTSHNKLWNATTQLNNYHTTELSNPSFCARDTKFPGWWKYSYFEQLIWLVTNVLSKLRVSYQHLWLRAGSDPTQLSNWYAMFLLDKVCPIIPNTFEPISLLSWSVVLQISTIWHRNLSLVRPSDRILTLFGYISPATQTWFWFVFHKSIFSPANENTNWILFCISQK